MILSREGESEDDLDSSPFTALARKDTEPPYNPDAVDWLIAEWNEQIPELDTSSKEVIYRIFRVRDRLHGLFLEDIKKVGLSDASFHLLTALRRSGPPYRLAPAELTKRYLTVTSGGVTQLIDRLSAQGLVTREDNPYDRRGVFVMLTQAGLQLIDQTIIERIKHEKRMLAGLSQNDLKTLSAILHQLLGQLEP